MDYCRICAKADKKPLIPVLEDSPLHIDEKLRKLLQITVRESSRLPKSICLDCLTKLNQFNDFFSTTQENQVILQIIFGEKTDHFSQQNKSPSGFAPNDQVVDNRQNPETFEDHYIIEEIAIDTLPAEIVGEDYNEVKSKESLIEENSVFNESLIKFSASSKSSKVPHKNKFDRFDCHLCNTKSSRNSKFIQHFKQIHPDKELHYSCYICRLLLTKYRSYIRHVASHTEKRFACDICGKNFAQKMTLIQHLNSHSNLKLFKCDECHLEFKQNSSLFKHRKTKHSKSTLTYTECAKSFVNKETLQQHMRSKHDAKKDIVCQHCSKTFASRSALSYHRSSKHRSGQVFTQESICRFCDKSFKSQVILNRHIKQSESCRMMMNTDG